MFNWTPEEIWCQLNFHFLLTKNQFNCFLWNRHQKEPVFAITYQKTWQLRLTCFKFLCVTLILSGNKASSLFKRKGIQDCFFSRSCQNQNIVQFQIVGKVQFHASFLTRSLRKEFCSYEFGISLSFLVFFSWSPYEILTSEKKNIWM